MRSKGFRFTLGVWGLSCVRQTLRNRPQPLATVRNRPQPSATVRNRSQPFARGRYGRAYGKFCKRALFWSFPAWYSSFRVSGKALCGIPTCFMTCQKSFFVAGAVLLRRFQSMRCNFYGRRSTLDISDVILRGRRSTLDVSCCVFCCESHCQRCAKCRQRANSVAGLAFCDMR